MCRLNVYIHDYLIKRGLNSTAEHFRQEANVEQTSVPVDAQQGLLFEYVYKLIIRFGKEMLIVTLYMLGGGPYSGRSSPLELKSRVCRMRWYLLR